MNALSDSRADAPENKTETRKILVWDAPVRVFHWLMVLSFAGAYLTAESERWRLVHVTLGYTMAGLVVFRILWGLTGTRYARFANFVRGPKAVAAYLRTLLHGKAEHHAGHNPAGALAIVALLGLTIVVGMSGWATFNDMAGHWLEEVHESAANIMLAVVGVHVAGVAVSSWLHRENLVRAMFTGKKSGVPKDGIRSTWRSVAAVVLVSVLGFWVLQWQGGPSGGVFSDRPVASAKADRHHHDED
ncbi:MAG: cytochrome b/b6 domain-containing protein [Burkholderiales bacterium]|nr:cytochrome b/b6 domain-containing protein [Burkholderiales bacterium]